MIILKPNNKIVNNKYKKYIYKLQYYNKYKKYIHKMIVYIYIYIYIYQYL